MGDFLLAVQEADFVDCVDEGAEPAVDAEHGAAAAVDGAVAGAGGTGAGRARFGGGVEVGRGGGGGGHVLGFEQPAAVSWEAGGHFVAGVHDFDFDFFVDRGDSGLR